MAANVCELVRLPEPAVPSSSPAREMYVSGLGVFVHVYSCKGTMASPTQEQM